MATQPKVGAVVGQVLTQFVTPARLSNLFGLALISDAEDSGGGDTGGAIEVSAVAGLVLEQYISKATMSNMFGLALVSVAELKITEATGALLSQSQP